MKRLIVLAGGVLALLAGNVHAEGCQYGKRAAMADAHDAVEEPIATEGLSPELLALLEAQGKQKLEETLVVPNIPN